MVDIFMVMVTMSPFLSQGVTAPDLVSWLQTQSDWYGARQAEVCDLILPYAR